MKKLISLLLVLTLVLDRFTVFAGAVVTELAETPSVTEAAEVMEAAVEETVEFVAWEEAALEELVLEEQSGMSENDIMRMSVELAGGSFGEGLRWSLDDAGVLTISGNGPMPDWVHSGVSYPVDAPWAPLYSDVLSIVIESGVTRIGNRAFYFLRNAAAVEIPDTVISIGEGAFLRCSALKSVIIPDSVADIGTAAFSGSGLNNVQLSSGITVIRDRVFNETGITQIQIPNGVTQIGASAFSHSGLTSITLPDSVAEIGESAFYACTGLKNVELGKGVVTIGDSAFESCRITDIFFPDGLLSIGADAFLNCGKYHTGLRTYVMNSAAVSDIRNWLEISFANETSNPLTQGAYLSIDGTEVRSITVPDGIHTINAYAFFKYGLLNSVTFNREITSIGRCAFYGTAVRNLEIPGSVAELERGAFGKCSMLSSVQFEEGLQTIGHTAFQDCNRLTEITIPDSVTTIGESAFVGVELETLTIGKGLQIVEEQGLPYTGKVFISDLAAWCGIEFQGHSSNPIRGAYLYLNDTLVTDLIIPEGVTKINNSAFSQCKGLRSVKIPDSVAIIGDSAFSACKYLTTVEFGAGVQQIGSNAFASCTLLSNMYFTGDAPAIQNNSFFYITANAYYYAGNTTWTENMKQDYGGTVTWVTYPPCDEHNFGDWTIYKEPTTKEPGEERRTCSQCGEYESRVLDVVVIPGDFDGDDKATELDAVYLLWHTLHPNIFPLEKNADFNGDGVTTDADAVILLWHGLYPKDYPLK